tara:strand:+ start:2282 stop:3016 length:735 start_codon:yes stop_codon:yes gene_type:complete
MAKTPLNQVGIIDPLTGLPVQQMTNVPPQQASTMGTSQPVFNPRATQAGTGLFGDMQQRQNSVNAPLMFKEKKIGMTQLDEITINGSKDKGMRFGKAAPGKGSGAHGDSKYEKATYQLMDEGAIDETSDANYGRILERIKKNEDSEKYNKIEDGSAGNLTKLAGRSPFNQEIKQDSKIDNPSKYKSFKEFDRAIAIPEKRVKYFKEPEQAPEVKMAKIENAIIQKPHKQVINKVERIKATPKKL